MGKVQEGTWGRERPLTVKELMEEHWLPAQRSRELQPTTLAQYTAVAESWIVPIIGARQVAALTPTIVNGMTEALKAATPDREGLSPRSRQLTVGILKAACAWA